MADVRKILSTVAPWIGAAATGGVPALVGMAAAQIGQAFGSDVKPTMDAIAQAVNGATPEQMLALKQADQQFQARMTELGLGSLEALEKVAADDRASARAMYTARPDITTPVLTLAVVLAFFTILFVVLTQPIQIPDGMRDVAFMLLGTLAASYTQVMNFRFGTSLGSKDKNEILKSLSR